MSSWTGNLPSLLHPFPFGGARLHSLQETVLQRSRLCGEDSGVKDSRTVQIIRVQPVKGSVLLLAHPWDTCLHWGRVSARLLLLLLNRFSRVRLCATP